MNTINMKSFQDIIFDLQKFWINYGCIIVQPIDIEVGAGTLHPITYLGAINPNPIFAAYVQTSRRPSDGRYGINKNRLLQYYQFQVILKPSTNKLQELYIKSLKSLKLDLNNNDIKFIEDNWEHPTLGAYGLGWEVWFNGMEITQITYLQKMGGLKCNPVMGEITYGLERLAMCIQKVNNIYDIVWSNSKKGTVFYKNIFYQNELENSKYYFEYINKNFLLRLFIYYEKEINRLINLDNPLILPAYELVMKNIHIFNILDASNIISLLERQDFILRINNLSKKIAKIYLKHHKNINFLI
ncbi:MAG: glycine--tRNA ligase subunit alpha [Candidatus Lightella neohaematopini]|nr:glycine--tRNA ligase subunit alpha [Candidatus Lightella neohaematopini]MCV2528787.1 glycine--tRNA ligase subunit alpha [Candidatus Lightella neohaematopini]